MPMHQYTPLSHPIDPNVPIDAVGPVESMTACRTHDDDEADEAWEAERDAEIAAKCRGREYARTCFECRHLPPDYRLSDPDPFIRTICESKRISRLMVHAREGCETCPYLPENYGKAVRGRVGGLDDWEDGPEVDRIRRARFEAWEAQHGSR
jgi:hypothetical protein